MNTTTNQYKSNETNYMLYQECIDEIEEIGKGKYICKKMFYKVAKRNDALQTHFIGSEEYYHWTELPEKKALHDWQYGSDEYSNVFGLITHRKKEYGIRGRMPYRENNYYREGIEILGCIPSKKTIDGKVREQRNTIKELKAICKMNGLKKYSKMKKIELYTLLMTI